MKKIYPILLVLLFMSVSAMAQDRKISGTVLDKETKEGVIQATIQLLKSDSTFVVGAASDENGLFSLTAPANGKYILKLTSVGYKNLTKNIVVADDKDIDLGKINLTTDAVLLKEVVANGIAAKVVVKEDTFIYNAAAYRTPEGSVVEELVKKIPGAQVDDEGNVTINGKSVKKIKVDGKEFLTGDTKTALKNLPTSIIDKVKAYDEKSDLAKVTGIDDGDETTVLDFGIKRGMNKGYLVNANLGYGTHKRYSEQLMAMYTKDNFRIMGFGNANNTNDMGFPGGGGGPRFGGGRNGLVASKMGALNVNYQGNKLSVDGGVRWNHQDGDAFSKTSSENFVSKPSSFSNSISNNYTRSNSWDINARVEWKPDSMTNIMFRPSYSYSTNDGLSSNTSGTFDEDPYLYVENPIVDGSVTNIYNSADSLINVNKNSSKSLSYGKNKNAQGMLQINRKLSSNGRNITFRADVGYTEGASNSISLQDLKSIISGLDDTYRTTTTNRYSATPTKKWDYTLQATYSEPIAKATFLQFRYRFKHSYSKSDRSTYDFSNLPDDLINCNLAYREWDSFLDQNVLTPNGTSLADYLDDDLSKFSEYTTNTHIFELMMRIIRQKYNLNFGVQLQPQRTHFVQNYQGVYTDTTRNVTNFTPTLNFRYKFSKVSQLRAEYRANTTQPSMTNLLSIVDDSNPTNVSVGNRGLKPSYTNTLRVFYNGYRQSHMQSWMANIGFNTTRNSVSNSTRYFAQETTLDYNDLPELGKNRTLLMPAGSKLTRPENINGNWDISGAIMFNTSVDTLGNWNVNTFTNINYSNNVGYVQLDQNSSSQKNTVKNFSVGERLSFSYRNDWLEVEPNGSLNYTHARNELQSSSNLDTWQFSYGVNVNITAPWGTSLSTSLQNNCRRGYNDASMNTNELIWNAQISQSFLKGKPLSVSLQFYDILQNQSNFSRSINAMQRTDSWYNSINSYAMLKVTYRFNAFGGKEARRGMRRGGPDGEGPDGLGPGGPDGDRGGRGGDRGGRGGRGGGPGGFGGGGPF